MCESEKKYDNGRLMVFFTQLLLSTFHLMLFCIINDIISNQFNALPMYPVVSISCFINVDVQGSSGIVYEYRRLSRSQN